MKRKLLNIGNSFAISIPKVWIEFLEWDKNEEISVKQEKGKIIISQSGNIKTKK